MKLLFLGTGAADYDWRRYGDAGVLGSAAALLEDHVLLDCGPTVCAAMERFGVDFGCVEAVVNTHSHGDHFDVETVKRIAQGRRVDFYGTPQACVRVRAFCRVHPVESGSVFTAGNCRFLTLPANHAVTDLKEETFNYLISCGEKTLLYALDTAWMLTKARRLIGEKKIDGIVWDATMSEPGDWRIFEHSDPEMFGVLRRVLLKTGNITQDTPVYFSHRARTLWPEDPAAQQKIAARYGALLAVDGETVTL
ncbi:MAG: MBL fold metallo-hydrolase [Lentisphaeria bacterium]|nr:MBL fold metallo-hydrolase [Lentisphaeria bacterium]